MTYNAANAAKASFENVYSKPTPHAYIASMAKSGYEIGEQARPFGTAAVELLQERNKDAWPVQMLDVGCSYGIGSAFIKYGCSFDEMVAFFASRAPHDYRAACETTRMWLNVAPSVCNVRTVGLDSSEPAIRFAVDAGLLDGGVAKDLERSGISPTDDDIAWFRSCNLLLSTGAVGYITERTMNFVLQHLGKDHPGGSGPFAVITILRMFDTFPIKSAFQTNGFAFGVVPGVRLPQRRFADAAERRQVLSLLHDRGIDTRNWEDRGKHFADLFIAAPPEQFPILLRRMNETFSERNHDSQEIGYIHR